jgi:hypothetical protein|tara:strand:- start:62 stop:265 length:204 start_codon:yes stop_codon:yes gene_type:complete
MFLCLVLLLLEVFVGFARLLFDEVVDEPTQDVLHILLAFAGFLLVFLTKILGRFFGNWLLLLVFAYQ